MESRMEAYLNAAISGNTENLPKPISRIDYLLCDLIEAVEKLEAKVNEIADTTTISFDASKLDGIDAIVGLFSGADSLIKAPLFDTSNVTIMYGMFSRCYSLTTVPLYDTSKVTNFSISTSTTASPNGMFEYCYSLETIPAFNTSKAQYMIYMFKYCYSLETIPALDTRNVISMYKIFYNCYSLTTVSGLDMRGCTSSTSTSTSDMFTNCYSLTNCYLYNIKNSIQVGSGTSYGHLLTLESLLHMIKELINTGSSMTFTVGTANLEKLANVYVRLIEITDEMRAEDEFIDSKLPFEVCESTDEGAQLITSYVTSKNWVLK